jgi:hypothetical protein
MEWRLLALGFLFFHERDWSRKRLSGEGSCLFVVFWGEFFGSFFWFLKICSVLWVLFSDVFVGGFAESLKGRLGKLVIAWRKH